METYLPYIVSVICATIAGFASYAVARKQAKADIQKLEKQHELDIEKEREKFIDGKRENGTRTSTSARIAPKRSGKQPWSNIYQ